MKTSRLVDEFLSAAWNLHGGVYNNLSGVLWDHLNGTKLSVAD